MPGTAGKAYKSLNDAREVGAPGCATFFAPAEDAGKAEGVDKFVACSVGTLLVVGAVGTLATWGVRAFASYRGGGAAVPSTAAGGVADGDAGGAGGFGVV